MGKYNDKIAGNEKVEMIHISRDRDEDAAEAWAAKEKFPWLTVLPDDAGDTGLNDYRTANYVPFYVWVDKDGEAMGTGSAVLEKAVELGGG